MVKLWLVMNLTNRHFQNKIFYKIDEILRQCQMTYEKIEQKKKAQMNNVIKLRILT